MLPAPTRIAAIPSPKSRVCWNPAVPPPPVAGAEVTNGLGVAEVLGLGLAGDGVGAGMIVELADGAGAGVTVGPADGVTVGVTVPGENGGGVADDPEPEQAEIAKEANMVRAMQPMTAKLAPWTARTWNGLFITGISG
jgi:hypothetical protein